MHTSPPHSQDSFVCLPPIRPVCFLSPHYEVARGAIALGLSQICTAVTNVGGTSVTCMNWSEKGRILIRSDWAGSRVETINSALQLQTILTVWMEMFLIAYNLRLMVFNDHISQQKKELTVLFGIHTHIYIHHNSHLIGLFPPQLPHSPVSVQTLCLFVMFSTSIFPLLFLFDGSPSALWPHGTEIRRSASSDNPPPPLFQLSKH